MDRFDAYLDILSQEEDYLDRLLCLSLEKREAILGGAADKIVALSNSEDSMVDHVLNLRKCRRAELSGFYAEAGVGAPRAGRAPLYPSRGRIRQLLLESAPGHLKSVLADSLIRYESKILRLRRETRVNATLLSDRLRLLHLTIEAVLSSAAGRPKEEYRETHLKTTPARSKGIPTAPSLLVDQKV